ncbi:LysR family transcriptional regulator [Marinomonas rhizomae]|uniref:DNA-binding transcriptional LysR family regulator n=1 Tax=Marinomonas rhizomae TaxID=491948 RepID=A0A366J2B7_9GAMM|nr:LysR family transcriptional regulator [Marinomonas rhizomae]RBP81082.1 DNA-binding transcriptional LysR family regulator [Marinomonas rhizomae]RNF72242.1 LysR family transcriptional regulator [Marinomonas rhizomae]
MGNLDLNLIRTFVMLYETRSVTVTAEQLFVTQPSISYALSKLRDVFKDRLFIRTKGGMEPTATAQQLYSELSRSLSMIENTITNVQSFDPAKSQKCFRVAMTDLGEMTLLPSIFARLQKEAPNVELEVVPLEIEKVDEWMSSGKIDAVICSRHLESQSIERHIIRKERYVCIINDKFSPSPQALTMEQFMSHRHAVVTKSLGHGAAEEALAHLGVKRKVSLKVSHFSTLPSVLEKTGVMTILPFKIATLFTENNALKIYELPFEVADFEVALHWQSRHNNSSSHSWFRELIIQSLSEY